MPYNSCGVLYTKAVTDRKMGEESMTEIKIKNQAAYIEPPPGGEELPAQCVVTHGLKDGPSETRRTKILKRYTLKRAESVEVETVRRDDGSVIYKLPLPIYLFDWLACLDDAGSISLTYVARHTDSYGARWELRNTGWNGDRGGYDFVVISDEELRVRALLTGQTIDKLKAGNSCWKTERRSTSSAARQTADTCSRSNTGAKSRSKSESAI